MHYYRYCQLEGQCQMPGYLLLTAAACSLLPSGTQRCCREMAGVQCSVLLTLIISNTTIMWFTLPVLAVYQCNLHRNMVKLWLENIHGNADFFLSIIHPGLWSSPPFLILHILFSQKMAKTKTYDTYARIRILKLRYSYGVLLLIWRYCVSLYGLVKTSSFLPIVSISVK